MTTANQQITTSFTPPPAASVSIFADSANAKAKVSSYLAVPAGGAPLVSTVNLLRSVSGKGIYATLVGATTLPISLVYATLSGFSAYRQLPTIPDVGTVHGWNLAKNGGFINPVAGEWTLAAQASRVADASSPSGWSLKLIATAGAQDTPQSLTVEAGKVYSIAAQMRSDGTMTAQWLARWLDAGGTQIGADVTIASSTSAVQAEYTLANQTAPGNARTLKCVATSTGAGTALFSCLRVKQQSAAPLAWSSVDHQVVGNQGLAACEATTNAAADADMEAVGTASYTATNATLAKDTTNKFAGSQSLKVTTTAAGGYAAQGAALATGQAVTASIRVIGGDAGTGLALFSTPSNAQIGTTQLNPNTTNWNTLRVSGTIAGGDTGWQVRLIGGTGVGVIANFDNLGVENKVYDTLNSDPSGLAYTATTRAASSDTETLDTGFNIADFGRVVSVRFDHAYNRGGNDRVTWGYFIDGNNRIQASISPGGFVTVTKVRAGVVSSVSDGGVTAPAAGDELSIGFRHNATIGLELQVAKNGGAIATYTTASAEAKNVLTGTPTSTIGYYGGASGFELDGTIGIDRHLSAGATAAQVTTGVGSPYADPTDYEPAVYCFNGQAYQVPVFDDHLVKLGQAYDWRADTSSGGTNAATAQGAATTATVLANSDSWWLKDVQTPAQNVKVPVLNEFPYKVVRPAQIISPIAPASQAETVIYGPTPYGVRSTLKFKYSNPADQVSKEAALRTLLASNDDIWIQSPFGHLAKVKLPAGLDLALHEIFLEGSLSIVEVL